MGPAYDPVKLSDGSTAASHGFTNQQQIDEYNAAYLKKITDWNTYADKRNKEIDLLSPSGSPGRSENIYAGGGNSFSGPLDLVNLGGGK